MSEKWINVKDDLPKENGDYLVYYKSFGSYRMNIKGFCKKGRDIDMDLREKNNIFYNYNSNWGYSVIDYVTHWRPLPKPPIIDDEVLISYIDTDNISVNKYGVNTKIQAHILSDKEMRSAGFGMLNGKWMYSKDLNRKDEISFNVIINAQDPKDLDILVIDEDFGQPYN